MNRVDFLIEWFHKENDRQFSLNDSLNIPIGILTAVFALLFYMFTSFSFSSENCLILEICFIFFILLSIICWILVVFYLFKSYNNLFNSFTYKGIPFPTTLNDQYQKLEQYTEENKELLPSNNTTDKLYETQLIEMLSEYLNQNISNNDKKSWYLHVAKKFLLSCLISTLLCSIPFIVHSSKSKESKTPNEVIIKNFNELPDKFNHIYINNGKNENDEQPGTSNANTSSKATTTPAATTSKTN